MFLGIQFLQVVLVQVALMTHPHVVLMCDPQPVVGDVRRTGQVLLKYRHVDGFIEYTIIFYLHRCMYLCSYVCMYLK